VIFIVVLVDLTKMVEGLLYTLYVSYIILLLYYMTG